jgi:peptide/nickel transport system substrate-binding protein
MTTRSKCLLVLIVALALLLGACKSTTPTEGPAATTAPEDQPTDVPQEPTAEPEPEEVVLRLGWLGDLIDCLNVAACQRGYNAWEFVYDGVVAWGSIGDPIQPRIAESWDISDDLMTYTFHLIDLEGATFHDGTPLTAEAIAWSFNYWAGNAAISWMYTLLDTSEGVYAEAVDDRTVVLQINEPMYPNAFLNYLGYVYIYPQHVWEEYDALSIYGFENLEAIGTGPFKLTEWNPGQYIIFDANENYYRGKPPVDRIVIQYYATPDAMVQALISGEIDAITSLAPVFADAFDEYPEITVFEKPPIYEHHLFFNRYEYGLGHPALDDVVIRQAIAHAIDKQQLVDVNYGGRAVASDSYWDGGERFEQWAHPTLKAHEFNLELAANMLEEAGYVDSDGDGVREMNDGSGDPLSFRFNYESDDPVQLATVEMIANWLGAIGIETQVEGLDPGTLYDVLVSSDFDLVVSVYGFDWDPDWQMFTLSSYSLDYGLNWPGYSNPDWDDLYLAQHYALTPEERVEYLWAAQELMHEDVPWIQLYHFNSYDAYRNDRFEFTIQDSAWETWHWWGIYGVEAVD